MYMLSVEGSELSNVLTDNLFMLIVRCNGPLSCTCTVYVEESYWLLGQDFRG